MRIDVEVIPALDPPAEGPRKTELSQLKFEKVDLYFLRVSMIIPFDDEFRPATGATEKL